jgi:hypothetical protein
LIITLRTPAEEAAWRAGEAERQAAAAAATAAGAGE